MSILRGENGHFRSLSRYVILRRIFRRNRMISGARWKSTIIELSNPQSIVCTRASVVLCYVVHSTCITRTRTSVFSASSERDLMSSTWRRVGRFPPVAEIGDSSLFLFLFLSSFPRVPNNAADRWKSVRRVKCALENRARHMAFVASDAAAAATAAVAATVCLGQLSSFFTFFSRGRHLGGREIRRSHKCLL